jgi:hypothetical protein
MNEMVAAVAGRRPRTLVPVLTAVFVSAWGLLILLVVMQDRMIDAQGELIHTFFNQSRSHLPASPAHVNGRMASKPGAKPAPRSTSKTVADDNQVQLPPEKSSAKGSVSQIPLSEQASVQSPSSQEKPKPAEKTGRSSRKTRSPFSPPPAEITDPSDQRRVSITI